MKNISKGTIIRTLCLVLAFVNHALTIAGKSPLPVDDATIEMMVAFVFDMAAAWAAWWKNNSVTPEAIKADTVLKDLKAKKAEGVQ